MTIPEQVDARWLRHGEGGALTHGQLGIGPDVEEHTARATTHGPRRGPVLPALEEHLRLA